MHQHECRYCRGVFMCGEDRAVCFRRFIVCDGCFWQVEFRYFLLVFVLAFVAVVMSLVAAEVLK